DHPLQRAGPALAHQPDPRPLEDRVGKAAGGRPPGEDQRGSRGARAHVPAHPYAWDRVLDLDLAGGPGNDPHRRTATATGAEEPALQRLQVHAVGAGRALDRGRIRRRRSRNRLRLPSPSPHRRPPSCAAAPSCSSTTTCTTCTLSLACSSGTAPACFRRTMRRSASISSTTTPGSTWY